MNSNGKIRYVADFAGDLGSSAKYFGVRTATLSELAGLGVQIPPGFSISNLACRRFVQTGDLPTGMWEEVLEAVDRLDQVAANIGDHRPRLWAVRSSPPVDMPALLGTALYMGATEAELQRFSDWGGPRLAADARLNHLLTYAKTIRGIPEARVTNLIPEHRAELEGHELHHLGDALEVLVREETQRPVPADRLAQLREAIEAVFASWDARLAAEYRRGRAIPDDTGTAAIVHLMVFGNLDHHSGVGVAFSRDPVTGEPTASGHYESMGYHPTSTTAYEGLNTLLEANHASHQALVRSLKAFEDTRNDLVRLDYVVEQSTLYILDGRNAERTPEAATRVAVDLVAQGAITQQEALLGLDPDLVGRMLHPRLQADVTASPIAAGSGASPGTACGVVVLDAVDATAAAALGEDVILIKRETTPEDIAAIAAVSGVVTSRGGRASHAALVSRGIGTPTVTGSHDMLIDLDRGEVSWGNRVVKAGDVITIDGTTGNIYSGSLPLVPAVHTDHLSKILRWADQVRTMQVWANADTPAAAAMARDLGAEGIGLARTEYMFTGDRLEVVQRILSATDNRDRADALEQLERLQVGDFEELLEVMDGLPVVVRLLDPPLHEFLPDRLTVEHELAEARALGQPVAELERIESALDLSEGSNPMLGLRGVRLAVVKPEIYRVQVLAALEAVRRRLDAAGDPRLELMIPLVGTVQEVHLIKDMIEEEVHFAGRLLEVNVGTMIELPRAALVAESLACESDFFSFGTNDLTQTTLGLSRDDAEEAFLGEYVARGLYPRNPFETIDPNGVGRLIRLAIEEGRAANPTITIGVCGEHGADPISIEFFNQLGINYVSCSPPRVPIARLAAAQAALRGSRPHKYWP